MSHAIILKFRTFMGMRRDFSLLFFGFFFYNKYISFNKSNRNLLDFPGKRVQITHTIEGAIPLIIRQTRIFSSDLSRKLDT